MPTIKLTDQFGLDVDAQPAPTSALLKYFQQLPSLKLDELDLSKVGGMTLDQPAVRSLQTGLSFQKPVDLGQGAPTLCVSAGAHGTLEVITDVDKLPDHDDGAASPDTCYVSFGIEATVSPALTMTSGVLQFGASPSTQVEAVSYTRFPHKTGVILAEAVKQTVGAFAIPGSSKDLEDLPAGQIVKVDVSGKLKLSGTADLLATTNPLATASLPSPMPTVSVSAGGSATVGVSCEVETEYGIVARKLDSGGVRLGWHHKKGSAVTVSAAVSEGISAGFGTTDLFSQVVGLISASPKADLKELESAGVPEDQASAIQGAVKAAACRKLEIAVSSGFTASDSETATFLYDIVPAALTGESRTAIDQALRGDLAGLHAPGLPGVTCTRSVWANVTKTSLELDVNLLGILNYRSVASLALEGKVMYEPATGALVIADQATAERIRTLQVNFGADIDKLRHVLAESFLITAAYRGTKLLAGPASLRSSHHFFELQHTTSRHDMARMLRTGLALALLPIGEADPPAGVADFGRTLFTASTDYNDDQANHMFLGSDGAPLPRECYETAGRNAIQFLVQEEDDDAVRRRPAIDDVLWNRMKDVGQPGFSALFAAVAEPLVGAITADYTTIQWWADAMLGTAQQLAKVRLWTERNPTGTFDDPDFQTLRQDLADRLREVAAHTREEFGQPWGLIAMDQLVAHAATAKMLITGPILVCNKARSLVATGGS